VNRESPQEQCLASQTFASWNLIGKFLRQLDSLQAVA
jgi:hypothetical protein